MEVQLAHVPDPFHESSFGPIAVQRPRRVVNGPAWSICASSQSLDCGEGRIRTDNRLSANQVLCQLELHPLGGPA